MSKGREFQIVGAATEELLDPKHVWTMYGAMWCPHISVCWKNSYCWHTSTRYTTKHRGISGAEFKSYAPIIYSAKNRQPSVRNVARNLGMSVRELWLPDPQLP